MSQRRPALSACFLAFASVLLLAGCGGEDQGEIVGTARPAASGSSGAAASPTAAASSGEYEAATPEHPARNVPRPVLSEKAQEETFEGAKAFMEYWEDSMHYLIQTGDAQYVRAITDDRNDGYEALYQDFEKTYDQGFWVVSGMPTYRLEPSGLWEKAPRGAYSPVVYQNRPDGEVWGKGKRQEKISGDDWNDQPLACDLLYEDGKWRLYDIYPIEGTDYGAEG